MYMLMSNVHCRNATLVPFSIGTGIHLQHMAIQLNVVLSRPVHRHDGDQKRSTKLSLLATIHACEHCACGLCPVEMTHISYDTRFSCCQHTREASLLNDCPQLLFKQLNQARLVGSTAHSAMQYDQGLCYVVA